MVWACSFEPLFPGQTGLREQLLNKIKTDYDEHAMRQADDYLDNTTIMMKPPSAADDQDAHLRRAYKALEGTF